MNLVPCLPFGANRRSHKTMIPFSNTSPPNANPILFDLLITAIENGTP